VEHNGIFSVALVHNQGKTLTLMTDFLGMGPLYYRRFADAVIFSTNPRFLTVAGDSPDLHAWRCLIQTGFISSDRTLSSQVRRVPSGSAIRFSSEGEELRQWFDYSTLPEGTRPVDSRVSVEVEEEFQDAITRCLGLQNDSIVLPLSSGYDSRRILATFLRRNVDFLAITAKVLQKEHRDLDARFARAMSVDFGFPHTIVEMGDASKYGQDDFSRRVLVDAETHMHTWVVRLMESLPNRPCIFFDGIAGDILGNPGYRMEGLYHSPPEDLELIVNSSITNEFESLLSRNEWPSKMEVREDIKDYLRPFLDRANIAELAFILLRQRRSTSLWSQQLLPSGHVVVCPYLDLNYVRRMLEYIPADKHRTIFQRRCLSEFWPEFFKYHGNRDIPANLHRGNPSITNERNLACHRRLNEEIERHDGNGIYLKLLTRNARLRHFLSLRNKKFALHNLWFHNRIMELCAREIRKKVCWNLA